ncbi:hypothetical protein RJ639_001893 [Escallonia herrerae]|uniref:Reverse transcriptase Ty1/copia-type domain-containing protein n=1 Tax=Escallonia herrerae TaxID=1293975 RepID=A0AA89BIE8_9ASTE|nr:hypothetical protein RJ639_001893 [Escallonia herrerae]
MATSETFSESGLVNPNGQHGGGTVYATPYVATAHGSVGLGETTEKFNGKVIARGCTRTWIEQDNHQFEKKAGNYHQEAKANVVEQATNNLEIHQMDVKTTFLNEDLNKEIYMEQPEGHLQVVGVMLALGCGRDDLVVMLRVGCGKIKEVDHHGGHGQSQRWLKVLANDAPELGDNPDQQIMAVVDAWKHSDFLCKNYILNGLDSMLYNVYSPMLNAKALWESLEKKYKTEDAGSKKFIVGKFLDFKMVDSKTVMNQVQEFQLILHDIHAEGMVIKGSCQVAALIEKLPPT